MNLKSNEQLDELISSIVKRNMDEQTWQWLMEKILLVKMETENNQLNVIFSSIQRKTDKLMVQPTEQEQKQIDLLHPGFSIQNWSMQRLCRMWLLMQINTSEKENYIKNIESVFINAEMNELVALYSSLPVLAYPQEWRMRCAEGIRSNIGYILEAIMYENPYPAAYLDEPAWNQLVLKAFFTDKDIDRIVGLDKRANKTLTATLIDYANERKSAGRSVNSKLLELVEKFSVI